MIDVILVLAFFCGVWFLLDRTQITLNFWETKILRKENAIMTALSELSGKFDALDAKVNASTAAAITSLTSALSNVQLPPDAEASLAKLEASIDAQQKALNPASASEPSATPAP